MEKLTNEYSTVYDAYEASLSKINEYETSIAASNEIIDKFKEDNENLQTYISDTLQAEKQAFNLQLEKITVEKKQLELLLNEKDNQLISNEKIIKDKLLIESKAREIEMLTQVCIIYYNKSFDFIYFLTI